jgi:phosphopantetheine binding protein
VTEISVAMIVECVAKVSNKDIREDTDIFSSGVDSLTVLRCRALLREQTGVKVPGHVFFKGRTPIGIFDLMEAENADR